jgi:Domain of unknown function (DUF4336)
MLRQVDKDLWVVDLPLVMGPVHLGTRSVIVRLPDGAVWMYTPGDFDAATLREIEALGPVRYLVAPSKLHHLFLAAAQQRWPEAKLYAVPGVEEKQPGIRIDAKLSDAVPDAWQGIFEQIPVGGAPGLNEVVFLHKPTRTLIVADIAFNVCESSHWFTRLFMRINDGYGRFGPTRIIRMMFKDRKAAQPGIDRILKLDFDRVIVGHGANVETGGREAMRAAFMFLHQ